MLFSLIQFLFSSFFLKKKTSNGSSVKNTETLLSWFVETLEIIESVARVSYFLKK